MLWVSWFLVLLTPGLLWSGFAYGVNSGHHCPGALPPVNQIISNIESEFPHLTVRAPFSCFSTTSFATCELFSMTSSYYSHAIQWLSRIDIFACVNHSCKTVNIYWMSSRYQHCLGIENIKQTHLWAKQTKSLEKLACTFPWRVKGLYGVSHVSLSTVRMILPNSLSTGKSFPLPIPVVDRSRPDLISSYSSYFMCPKMLFCGSS